VSNDGWAFSLAMDRLPGEVRKSLETPDRNQALHGPNDASGKYQAQTVRTAPGYMVTFTEFAEAQYSQAPGATHTKQREWRFFIGDNGGVTAIGANLEFKAFYLSGGGKSRMLKDGGGGSDVSALRSGLEQAGVAFSGVPGSSLNLDGTLLLVVQTPENLAKIQEVVTRYNGASPGNNDLAIVSAIFGAGTRTHDVTARVEQLVQPDSETVTVSNASLQDDPAPYVAKTLQIAYHYQGQPKTIDIPEGGPLSYLTLVENYSASVGKAAAVPKEYIVKTGDTFWKIARNVAVPLDDLLAVNPGIDPAKLQIGQRLNLPAKDTK